MEKKVIKVDQRVLKTKHSVKGLRQEGYVPGIIYSQKIGSIPINVREKDLTGLGGANLIELVLPSGSYHAIVREVQRETLTRHITHVDFQQVELDTKIRAELPVILLGEARGTQEGGVIQAGERLLEVEGYPQDLPENLEVEITNLEIGDKLTVRDLPVDLPYKILSEPDTLLVIVVATRMAAEEETDEEKKAGGQDLVTKA